ncbi:MAG: crossover junction endodeoxyribonuclease RuvC [Waddliaceae bacterium]|nr:crossover junction endodeoxyribonuclease RuvC [Waddliaceae bacterium]MBT3579157.1 crossover junction endodeoxyribonuclease RuvC [Waddliaceae bacterium]MBT4444313.1 crossover junction endodeoxyribonuclease RuvC [Waddliaceae bacterium]MBT6928528.1 crossover junction endodeoxyribonuclease RuvC [Waddliaceae bacterium]MBT7264866.1 crossover junction endodeoxyribonuclease RuvC [Waddliaceae bacterium]
MIIIGIDPGTVVTGYGIIDATNPRSHNVIDYGCIRPPRKDKLSQRYRIIFDAICVLLDKHNPTALVVETQYVGKNPQSAIKLGMARGMAILAATLRGIPVFEYTPSKVKLAAVGQGNAKKHQVQNMIKVLLKLAKEPPEDAADALALAICHSNAAHNNWHEKYEM